MARYFDRYPYEGGDWVAEYETERGWDSADYRYRPYRSRYGEYSRDVSSYPYGKPYWARWSQPGPGSGAWTEPGPHTGRGPKNYRRSDARIQEDINERLTQHPEIDAREIEVTVQSGEVTLTGAVEDRWMRRRAEDVADSVSGVRDVHNRLRVMSAGPTQSA